MDIMLGKIGKLMNWILGRAVADQSMEEATRYSPRYVELFRSENHDWHLYCRLRYQITGLAI
jgi:hypothetical protein